jgi:general secretion pathway protein G
MSRNLTPKIIVFLTIKIPTLTRMSIPSSLSRRRQSRSRRAASGFTLTEILIAIALIVILVATAVANLSGIFTQNQGTIAKLFVTQDVDTPLLSYRMATGSYPTTEQGLQALVTPPNGVSGWNGPYLKGNDVPLDPWHNAYHYRYPGVHNLQGYDCWSTGPSGVDGGPDNIGNWN